MSHFYGTLQGCRGTATRTGSKNSGMESCAASWSGAIRVDVIHNNKTGEDTFNVYQTPWQGRGISQSLASGVVGKSAVSLDVLENILKNKKALPVLIGLDPTLDQIIDQKLKGSA